MNMLSISWKYNEYVYCDCIYPEMTGCLAHTFGGEIPRVPGAAIKNTCLITLWLLSLQLRLFTASVHWWIVHSTGAYGNPRGKKKPSVGNSTEGIT